MTHYFQLSGGGNDFLALVEPESTPSPAQVIAWCRRGLSVGADGLFVLKRSPLGAHMTYFNADGSEANLCLNGTRCAVQLACYLGWAEDEIDIVTGVGALSGRKTDESRAALIVEIPAGGKMTDLVVDSGSIRVWQIRVGVPHVLVLWHECLETAPVTELGARLRSHPDLGNDGANASFVRFPKRNRIEIRTFERGVEAETLACGTGVLAAVSWGLELDQLDLPVCATTLGGFDLSVEALEGPDGDSGRWIFGGDARIISEGDLLEGALELPSPVRWSP